MNFIIKNYWLTVTNWTLRGQTTRRNFWYFILVNAAIVYATATFETVMFDFTFGLSPIYGAYILVTAWPIICMDIRRLKDVGYSQYRLLWGLIPIIGWVLLIYWWTRPTAKAKNRSMYR